ncbi:MAG: hypothetical protein JNK58_02700 [Phycisphaerae bacterium]|nr:hypothetical protein [Phycisphaerae bacterium]
MPPVIVVPVGVIARRNKVVRRFAGAGALRPESARNLDELGLTHGDAVRHMIKDGVLREVPGGRFWLDEAANAALHRRNLWYVAGVVLGVMAAVVAILLFVR